MIHECFCWELTGDKWLDSKIRAVMDFNSELNSCAAHSSPLTLDDRIALNKKFKSINTLLNKVAKRERKRRKK